MIQFWYKYSVGKVPTSTTKKDHGKKIRFLDAQRMAKDG